MALALTAQLLRIVGIFFTAYLTRKIGAEGIGLYQLILSVYFLASTLASSGIGTAVSRLTAETLPRCGGRHADGALRKALPMSLLLGFAAGAAVYFLAAPIGGGLLKDARTIPSIRMLAAGLPFIAMSSCLQGYFFGVRKALQPSIQMLFEQGIRMVLIVGIVGAFIPRGLGASCFAIILCCMISEALSCAFAFVLYIADVRKGVCAVREQGMLRKLGSIALPVALTGWLRAGFKTAENVLIPSGLRAFGKTEGQALSQYGLIGMAAPVLFFPSGILAAAAILLIPEASEARAAGNTKRVERIFARAFRMTVLFALLFGVLFTTLGNQLGELIFRNTEAGQLITALAPLVPLMYLDFVVDALLTGLNQQMKTLRINMLDYALRVGLILLLIPRFGFIAYIAMLYFSTALNATLSIRRLLIASGCRIDYPRWIWGPLLSAAIAGGLSLLTAHLLHLGGVVGVTLQALLMSVLYIALLRLTRCLTREDVGWMKDLARTARQRKA